MKIGSRVKAIEDDTSASEALAAVVKRLPLSTLQRPSAGAQQLGNEVVDDLVDRLLAGIREKNERQGDLHPFAGFAGGPSGIEGGIQ